jgi:protein SCO1/2
LLVLPASLLFVASAFALKWRSEHRQAEGAAVLKGEAGKSCCTGHGQPEEGIAFEVPAFSLTERSGRKVGLDNLKGSVWVANFIYTTCPGPCPMMTARLAGLIKELPVRDDLKYVSFSVDPEHDTPEVLARFADRYGADADHWLFLTGSREEIHALSTQGFKLSLAAATQPGGADGPIVHATRFALVDRDGRIRGYYDGLNSEALGRLKAEIRKLLEDNST